MFAFLVLLLSGLPLQQAEASPGWWNTHWSHRKEITITESSGSALANYQVKIDVSYESAMQADFGDLRFTNASDIPLDYWLESKTDGSLATVWVEVDSIAASADTTIYMYYGNPTASSASSGDATFNFFDDFSDGTLNKWKYLTGASVVTDDTQPSQFGAYAMNLNTGTNYVKCDMALMGDAGIRVLMKDLGTGSSGSPDADGVVGLRGTDSNTYDGILVEHDTDTGFHFDRGAVGSVPKDYITFDIWEWQEFVAYGTIPSNHKAKHWEYGTAEPSIYSLTATSVSDTAAGLAFLRVASGQAHISVVTVRKYVSPEPTVSLGAGEKRPSRTVGGEVYPINKAAVLAPWIGLALVLILAADSGALILRRRQTHK
jgi:hypothetical protein